MAWIPPKTNWGANEPVGNADMNRIESNTNELRNDSSVVTLPTSLNLGYGLQVISVPRTVPYNVLNITGRTLINLLGRDGACDNVSRYTTYQATIAIVPSLIVGSGKGALEVTNTSSSGPFASASSISTCSVEKDKYYISIAVIKGTTGFVGGIDFAGVVSYETMMNGNVQTIARKFTPTANNSVAFTAYVRAIIPNQKITADDVRLYEISKAEYDSLPSGTLELNTSTQYVASKYPYVDDMKSIVNPYVIKQGENLASNFNEWSLTGGNATISVIDPYRMQLVAPDSNASFYDSPKIPVISGQQYTISASVTNGSYVQVIDSQGVNASVTNSVTTSTFTARESGTVFLRFSQGAAGTFVLNNPMLNLGSTALATFKPKADDYLLFPNVQLTSNVDNTIYDTLSRRDGKYWKLSRFKTMDLEGSLPWTYSSDFTGFKMVRSGNGIMLNNIKDTGNVIKYDGKLLVRVAQGATPTTSDAQVLLDSTDSNPSSLILTIADTDSGWGEDYTPSQAEIQAYFYGWKMYESSTANPVLPYNGTGTKAWAYRFNGYSAVVGGDYAGGTSVVPLYPAPKFAPYKLQYQLATPTVDEIAVEGDITLHEGSNQIEVGNGMIVRERANPMSNGTNYFINLDHASYPGNKLKNRVLRKLAIYRNEKIDSQWNTEVGAASNGLVDFWMPPSNYDTTAIYTTTYIAEQYSLTCNVLSIQGEYASNLKMVVDTLATNQADVVTRVGALENTKAQKDQPQWIDATLLNSWTTSSNIGLKYRKIEGNRVELKCIIIYGLKAKGTILAKLAYKPTVLTGTIAATFDLTSNNTQAFVVVLNTNGDLQIYTTPGTGNVVLDVISFTTVIPLD